jgi:hypothetical protein
MPASTPSELNVFKLNFNMAAHLEALFEQERSARIKRNRAELDKLSLGAAARAVLQPSTQHARRPRKPAATAPPEDGMTRRRSNRLCADPASLQDSADSDCGRNVGHTTRTPRSILPVLSSPFPLAGRSIEFAAPFTLRSAGRACGS